MFSGKTTEIMRRVKRLQSIGLKCIVVNLRAQKKNHRKKEIPAINIMILDIVGNTIAQELCRKVIFPITFDLVLNAALSDL
tara:strand:+ start:102 stop:344 length:243 start_codon:yes stop_codon:yes gene_type:complete